MTFAYKIKSPLRSDISIAEKSVVSTIFEFDSRVTFGISDNNLIRAVFLSAPPSSTLSQHLARFSDVTSIGINTCLCDEDPMELYTLGCLDDLIATTVKLDLILFLADRIPITVGNLTKLSRIRSLRYLRLVGNINSENLGGLHEFKQLESLTITECRNLDFEMLVSLVNETRIPEIILSQHQLPPHQLDELRAIATPTSIRVVDFTSGESSSEQH